MSKLKRQRRDVTPEMLAGAALVHQERMGWKDAPCQCPQRRVDLICYGQHICRDGVRIDPMDFYTEPEA